MLPVRGLDAEADAVARRHTPAVPSFDQPPSEMFQIVGGRIERLVEVQVEPTATVGGGIEEHLDGTDGVGLELGRAADGVDATLECCRETPAVLVPVTSGQGGVHQRHDLHVHAVAERTCGFQHGVEVIEARADTHVDVCSDRRDAVLDQGPHRSGGAGDAVVATETALLAGLEECVHRASQVAAAVVGDVRRVGLVEVGVGLDERWQDQRAPGVEVRRPGRRVACVDDAVNSPVADLDVDEATVEQSGVVNRRQGRRRHADVLSLVPDNRALTSTSSTTNATAMPAAM